MEDLVYYLDGFMDDLREQLMKPRVRRDKRWQRHPSMRPHVKSLPFQKRARSGKLGLQMGKEALVVWIQENIPDDEEEKRRGKKP